MLLVSILSGYGYFPVREQISNLDNITYTSGEFSYYQTKRKYRSRKKSTKPFRKFLLIYLKEDSSRYIDGSYFLDNLEQNALLMIFQQWPRDTIEIGYLPTEDSGLREMYDIKHKGKSLVNLDGIRSNLNTESIMMLIFSLLAGILAILVLLKHIQTIKKT